MISVSCRGRRLYRAQKILTGRDLSPYCTGLYVHFLHLFAQLVLRRSHSAKTELNEETWLNRIIGHYTSSFHKTCFCYIL
jgi:hypothetical protein